MTPAVALVLAVTWRCVSFRTHLRVAYRDGVRSLAYVKPTAALIDRVELPSNADPGNVIIQWTVETEADEISRHIVLTCTNFINLLNCVPEHDSLTLFMLHRTKCKQMHLE